MKEEHCQWCLQHYRPAPAAYLRILCCHLSALACSFLAERNTCSDDFCSCNMSKMDDISCLVSDTDELLWCQCRCQCRCQCSQHYFSHVKEFQIYTRNLMQFAIEFHAVKHPSAFKGCASSRVCIATHIKHQRRTLTSSSKVRLCLCGNINSLRS